MDLSFVVQIPKDNRRTNFIVPETITIGELGVFQLRDGAHCVMCHGSGHRQEYCPWTGVIEKVRFDLTDLEASLPT